MQKHVYGGGGAGVAMAQPLDSRAGGRSGSAPSSVSMAVVCVVIAALTPALIARSGPPSGGALLPLALVVGLPLLWGASALLTAVYVLPTVALGHWLGRLAGHGRRWWWVTAGTTVGLLPILGLATVARILQSGTHEWLQLSKESVLFAGALWAASVPASLAVHATVLREDAGRPVRPVGDILLWGTLALSIELTAWFACL